MCFSTPSVPAVSPPPTARDATRAGVQKRQAVTADTTSTQTTGAGGDTSQATTYKSKLGE